MFHGLRIFNRDVKLVLRRGKVIDYKYYIFSIYRRHSTYLNELFSLEENEKGLYADAVVVED